MPGHSHSVATGGLTFASMISVLWKALPDGQEMPLRCKPFPAPEHDASLASLPFSNPKDSMLKAASAAPLHSLSALGPKVHEANLPRPDLRLFSCSLISFRYSPPIRKNEEGSHDLHVDIRLKISCTSPGYHRRLNSLPEPLPYR